MLDLWQDQTQTKINTQKSRLTLDMRRDFWFNKGMENNEHISEMILDEYIEYINIGRGKFEACYLVATELGIDIDIVEQMCIE